MKLIALFRWLLPLLLCLSAPAFAAESTPVVRESATIRLITAENAVAPGAGVISAGLKVEMTEGWKTYWRNPGEVGLPPEILWDGSENVAEVALHYPAPTRFTAFEIENFGYGGMVTYPLQVTLERPGDAARLTARATILVCAEICIPETAELSLDLPQGTETAIDQDNATALASASRAVPLGANEAGLTGISAFVDETRLVVTASRDRPFIAPDIFPEVGDATFGKPDIRLSDGGKKLWALLPTLYLPEDAQVEAITLTDGNWAVTSAAEEAMKPASTPAGRGLLYTALLALIGGLILNVMPCVLPVLSLKIGHALQSASHSPARIRAGFLASAGGILGFMWLLGAIVLTLQGMGRAVGWGVQFQSPLFLSLMILLMVLFAANMAGFFEINLPEAVQRRMGGPQGAGLAGDFATGAFAAVMATPCSAPFLGTAIAFAMAGGALDVGVIFTALGLGLALPYLLFAARPGLVTALPKPGPWMVWVKSVLAGFLGLTALWLLTVLWGAAGLTAALILAAISLALFAVLARRSKAIIATALIALGLILPVSLASAPDATTSAHWTQWEKAAIPEAVAAGQVVFVDVTADWCLTCKANKTLVLDRAPISDLLASDDIIAMQADWTRPSAEIQSYLKSFGRYGIPFNVVYGPSAPSGLPLPELLTASAVQEAIAAAR